MRVSGDGGARPETGEQCGGSSASEHQQLKRTSGVVLVERGKVGGEETWRRRTGDGDTVGGGGGQLREAKGVLVTGSRG